MSRATLRTSYQFKFNKCSSANSVTGFSLERADTKFGLSRGRSGAKSGLSTVYPLRDLPGWLENFTEHLVDETVGLPEHCRPVPLPEICLRETAL